MTISVACLREGRNSYKIRAAKSTGENLGDSSVVMRTILICILEKMGDVGWLCSLRIGCEWSSVVNTVTNIHVA